MMFSSTPFSLNHRPNSAACCGISTSKSSGISNKFSNSCSPIVIRTIEINIVEQLTQATVNIERDLNSWTVTRSDSWQKAWVKGRQSSVQSPTGDIRHQATMAERWKCVLCSFVCLFLSQLLSHLNTIHRNDVDFHQKCGLPGCLSKTDYTSTNSLIKHVRTSHHALLNCTYETVHNGVDETGT